MKIERLFYNYINFIEIEISSKCNRSCSYCPQSIIDRERELFPLEELKKILIDLQCVDYSGAIAFHQYNEPLLEYEHLCKCIDMVKRYLPNTKLELFTNGDLLTRRKFKCLKKIGVDEFQISCQINHGEEWNIDLARKKVKNMRKKIKYYFGRYFEDEFSVAFNTYKAVTVIFNLKLYKLLDIKSYPTMVKIKAENYASRGSNRLNSLRLIESQGKKEYNCSFFCRTLMHGMHISYKGNAYLCCDCCEDTAEAIPFRMGSIYDGTIFQLFENKLPYIKNYLFGEMPSICKECFWNQ